MVGARYDRYNPDADATRQRAASLVPVDRTYSTLASWRCSDTRVRASSSSTTSTGTTSGSGAKRGADDARRRRPDPARTGGLLMRTRVLLACAVACAGAGACSSGVTADAGDDAYMQVPGARFVRGAMPAGSATGPAVTQVALVNSNIWAGLSNDPISGALGPTATAAAIGLEGDVGYWVVGAGVPSVATPTSPSFVATASFSRGIVLGSYRLVVRAVDEGGHYGDPATLTLVAETSPTNPPASGALVVTLTWDTEANLSLSTSSIQAEPRSTGTRRSSQPPFAFAQTETAAATARSTTTRTPTASSTGCAERTRSGPVLRREGSTPYAWTRRPSVGSPTRTGPSACSCTVGPSPGQPASPSTRTRWARTGRARACSRSTRRTVMGRARWLPARWRRCSLLQCGGRGRQRTAVRGRRRTRGASPG